MVIQLTPQLEEALNEQARRRGISPETFVLDALREQLLHAIPAVDPQDEWERTLFAAAVDCGVSLPDSAFSRNNLYE